jgi:GNAT superfamily N-acetyltransferase
MEDVGPDRLGELSREVHELYRRCFAEPPWSESPAKFDEYPARLAKQLTKPGVSGVIAQHGAALAGVVYGWPAPDPLPADDPFYVTLPAAIHHLLRGPALEVVELMVHPDHRGRGIGAALLDRLVSGHRTAWLCTHPHAPATRLYERAGWIARGTFAFKDQPRVVYTWDASAPSTGSTARTAVPEPSLR